MGLELWRATEISTESSDTRLARLSLEIPLSNQFGQLADRLEELVRYGQPRVVARRGGEHRKQSEEREQVEAQSHSHQG